jgi:hypothetical protein
VLQGPNLRLSGKRLLDGLKGLWKDVKKLQFRQAMGTAGGAIAGAGMADTLSRLVQLALQDGELRIVKSIMLPPEIYPFFIQPDRKGSVYVSGINRAAPDFGHVELSIAGLRSLLDQLKNMAQVGRILKVSAADGSNTTELKGFAIYYDISLLPAGQLLVSVVRLNPTYFPPKISLDWGFEIGGKGFVKLREIANSTFKLTEALKKLLPPYSYEQIGVQ